MIESERQAALTRAASAGIAEWLKASGVLDKAVRHLRDDELDAMAAAAVSGYIVERSRQEKAIREAFLLPDPQPIGV